jgi:predicted nucleic acid-binding Zn ribbon protein
MENKEKYIIKNCKHHGETKFILENRGYYRCTKCRMDAVSRKRKKLKKDLVEYKGGKCEKCGYNKCVAAMDFHHKDPKEKDFGLSGNGNTQSWEKLKKEADKCLLLCANCHRELHEELNGYIDTRTDIKKQAYKTIYKESSPSRKKAAKKHNKCLVCGIDTYNNKYCSDKCCKLAKRKVNRPDKEKLIELLKINNWTQTAKIFGVSDNAVRKWAKQYNIDTNRKNL